MTPALVEIFTFPTISNNALGAAVPTPTFPAFVTTKLVAVLEPTTKAGPDIPLGLIDKRPQGDVVAIPTFPLLPLIVNIGIAVVEVAKLQELTF